MAEDVTFCYSERDGAGTETWHDEDGDAKAWQDGAEDRGWRSRDNRENEIVLKNVQDIA
jgi:hypothetical protein